MQCRCVAVTLCLCALLTALSRAGAGEREPEEFEIGRRFKIAPRVESRNDVPSYAVAYKDLPISRLIPDVTTYYRIHPRVRASAFSYFFHLRGYYGRFTVGTVTNLAKLIHEFAVLEEIRHGTAGIDFRRIAARIRQEREMRPVEAEVELALPDPEAVGPDHIPPVGRDESGTDRSAMGRGADGAVHRAIAYKLGVDVYTSNVILREVLRELGALELQDTDGWVVPSYIKKPNELNLLSGDDAVERRIRDLSPEEMRERVGEELRVIFRETIDEQEADLTRLLRNPNHSPRNLAYIAASCTALANVVNLSLLLPEIANAETPEEADTQVLLLRFQSLFHEYIQPIRGFMPVRRITAAVGTNGVIYMFFWGDTMLPWRLTANSFPIIAEEAEEVEATGVEFWLLGDADRKMVELAEREGITIHQNALYDTRLRPDADDSWLDE